MKNIIKCDSAPAALGPYSHACEANGFIFTSGQLGIDPATGKLAEGVEAQAHQALVNIDNVLKTAGATMKDILKTTIFLVDLNDFANSPAVPASRYPSSPPAALLRSRS